MRQYSEFLKSRCPKPLVVSTGLNMSGLNMGGGSGSSSSGGGGSVVYRLPQGDEVAICYLVNTGEYCSTVVPQLESMIKGKMDPVFADKVDLDPEVEVFYDLVAHALKVLVAGILDRLEPAFKAMQAVPWASLAQVNEESQYIHMCNAALTEATARIRESLAESYFRIFCTKLATDVLQRYLDVIMRQKRIAEVGSQQLLLDTYNIKTLLLHLQNLGMSAQDTRPPVPPVYTKLVMARIAHIETVLKLVGTPEELLVERFRIMWPEGSGPDLQSILALKGLKKADQASILDSLGRHGPANASQGGALAGQNSGHASDPPPPPPPPPPSAFQCRALA